MLSAFVVFKGKIMKEILIGKIVASVGLKGEVKVYNYSDSDRFDYLNHIYLKVAGQNRLIEYGITNVRSQKNMIILKLSGIDTRNDSDKIVNKEVFITEDDLRELPEDSYYIRDLIGLKVINIEDEQIIGHLKNVNQNSAQDNYEIELENKKTILIPAVKEFVKEVNIKEGVIKIKLIPGFIDDAVEV